MMKFSSQSKALKACLHFRNCPCKSLVRFSSSEWCKRVNGYMNVGQCTMGCTMSRIIWTFVTNLLFHMHQMKRVAWQKIYIYISFAQQLRRQRTNYYNDWFPTPTRRTHYLANAWHELTFIRTHIYTYTHKIWRIRRVIRRIRLQSIV